MIKALPSHGGQLRRISERYGIPPSELLDFSANINPEGPPAGVLTALRAALAEPYVLLDYPDLEEAELKSSIARYVGISADQIAVANGFVPLLEAVLRTHPIQRCLLPVPAFNEYRKALVRAGVEIIPFALSAKDDFTYDIDAMLQGDYDAILLANPQNPTGVLCAAATLQRLVEEAAKQNVLVLLDEAFIDYVPTQSLSRFTSQFKNLIVFRSVTKFHGVPGLRVAYAVSAPANITVLNQGLAPWPITTLAALAITAALADAAYIDHSLSLNRKRREQFEAGLKHLGIASYSSAANYLLLQLPPSVDADLFWERMLQEHHIVLRSCHDYEALPPGHLRAAVRTETQIDLFLQAASQVLGGGAHKVLR